MSPIRTILVANRGEIACRIFRTARDMGLDTVAVFADPDTDALHVREADTSVRLPGTTSADTYLNIDAVLKAAQSANADAIHPGYGFLAENADFAQAVTEAGLTWIGPPSSAIAAMARKVEAKRLAEQAGVPLLAGATISDDDPGAWQQAGKEVGYPLLVKASSGGGGRGMRLVDDPDALTQAITSARREAESSFGDQTVFLERYLAAARHIEIQILADQHGTVLHLGERECSVQRRHQKVIEESPSPAITPELRKAMGTAACALAAKIGYVNAGTVEFLVEDDGGGLTGTFAFLEMNTRLQVEHPVTEAVTGLDIVRLQLEIAAGKPIPFTQDDVRFTGHAIEARIYAEDPASGYLPSVGTIERWQPPDAPVRWDSGIATASEIATQFDPMLAKAIAHAHSRDEAAARLARALRELQVHGVQTNVGQLAAVLNNRDFRSGRTTTAFLDKHPELTTSSMPAETREAHAIAATLWAALHRHVHAPVLAFGPTGWRNVRSAPAMTPLRFGEEPLDVTYSFGRNGEIANVAVSGIDIPVTLYGQSDTDIDLAIRGMRARYTVAQHGDILYVNHTSGQSRFSEMPRFVEPGAAAAGGGSTAPVPGQVVAVEVSPGQNVTAGDTLVVMEAMKMEHRITAPADAIIAEVLVSPGDTVDAHHVLVLFENELSPE